MATADLLGLSGPENPYCTTPPPASTEHELVLEGECRTFVMRLPCDLVYDLSDTSKTRMFLYCWLDTSRGKGAHIHYTASSNVGESPSDKQQHVGEYSMKLKVRPEEVDLLKATCYIQIKDESTQNTKDFMVSSGAIRLDRLLMGREETATLSSVFDPNNYTAVKMRLRNANMFANSQTSLVAVDDAVQGLPEIKFRPSSLWRMGELGDLVDLTSDTLRMKMDKCKIQGPAGGEQFLLGKTRWTNGFVVFFSLFMGTPAYTLILTM